MNKKLIIGSFIILLIIGCVGFNLSYQRINIINADREILINDFEDLEKESDLIIMATVKDDKENILLYDDEGDVVFGYTLTKLEVEEVYKGSMNIGENITITEEYFVTKDVINGNQLYVQGNYLPSKESNTYVFFLKKYAEDTRYRNMYFPIDLEYGKYVYKSSLIQKKNINEVSNEELEVGDKADELYKIFYGNVLQKYLSRTSK